MAVGSLPQADAPAAVKAQCLAFPEIPAWPQLPKRSVRERLTLQGLGGLPGLHIRPEGTAVLREPEDGWDKWARQWAEARKSGDLDSARLTPDDAAGFFAFLQKGPEHFHGDPQALKGQTVGPVTLGMALRDPEGRPLLADPSAMEALVQYLANHALWQVRTLGALKKPLVFFLDEPSRGGWDPAGAGLDAKTVRDWYGKILEPLQDEGVLTGLHVCGKGPFGWAFETSAEALHFDAHRYLESLLQEAGSVRTFLDQGGHLSFGLVPTAMTGGSFPQAAALVDRWMAFAQALSRQGVPSQTLASRTSFSTSCGLGGGSLAVAEEASRCLAGLTSLWKITVRMGLPS